MAHGIVRNPRHQAEVWTLHELPEGRRVLRVEIGERDLWHVSLDPQCCPERIQARLHGPDGSVTDVTLTFFDDECLIWRKGTAPVSEAVALPRGYRVLWPPFAGRGLFVAAAGGLSPSGEAGAAGPTDVSWLRVRMTPGQPALTWEVADATLEHDATGWIVRWAAGDADRATIDAAGILRQWEGPEGSAEELEPGAMETGHAHL